MNNLFSATGTHLQREEKVGRSNPIQSNPIPDVTSTSKPRPRKHFYTCLSSICGSQYNLSELYMYDFPNPCVQFTFSIYLEPVNFSWVQYSKLKLN